MFYDIILGTSQTMTSKAVSCPCSKNNTQKQWLCTSNNDSALKTKNNHGEWGKKCPFYTTVPKINAS